MMTNFASSAAPMNYEAIYGPTSHTKSPIVTGTSVIAVKYKNGVLIASDTIGSYGSLQRFTNIKRITKVGKTLIGADGDLSDFQHLEKFLEAFEIEEQCIGDGFFYSPKEMFHRLTTLLYEKRSKVDPFWNNLVVAGTDDQTNQPFIGCTDKLGTPFECDFVATGFGLHIAQPLLAKRWKADMTYDQAKELVTDALKLCFYRDCRAGDNVLFAKAEGSNEVEIDEKSTKLQTRWNYDAFSKSTWDLPS